MGAEIANDELVKKQFGVYRMFQKCLLKDDASYVLGNIAVHKTIFISVETHDVSSRYEEDFDMAKLCPQDSSLGRYSAIDRRKPKTRQSCTSEWNERNWRDEKDEVES